MYKGLIIVLFLIIGLNITYTDYKVEDILYTEVYENNRLITNATIDYRRDIKVVSGTGDKRWLQNHTDGYKVALPKDILFDFSMSPFMVKANNDNMDIVITREWSEDEDVNRYIEHYLNRFIINQKFLKMNNIRLINDGYRITNNNLNVRTITIGFKDNKNTMIDTYTYAYILTPTNTFYRIMFKYNNYNETGDIPHLVETRIGKKIFLQPKNFLLMRYKENKNIIRKTIDSFTLTEVKGEAAYDIELKPDIPEYWSTETRLLYNEIQNSNTIKWGIFSDNIETVGLEETVPKLEGKMNNKFDVLLNYVHYRDAFPIEFMKKAYSKGKIVELTYQMTTSNNTELFGYTPSLDFYRGKLDEEIREFAKGAKQFGHPFLFRLNNEMNTDWTSYSGVVNLCDPDIYINNWRRVYKIFEEEGVNNAIWIFNPHDRSYPPCNWNHFMAYYPGNEYVHMLGLTGYNNGTYYEAVTREKWREFKEIYDEMYKEYMPLFSKFPWIITEFASSSIGGDKTKWIQNMFHDINEYPNIKIAVWFNSADYDIRPGYEGKVARPYWIDETPETLGAFIEGINGRCEE